MQRSGSKVPFGVGASPALSSSRPIYSAGFSLVEVMVAMVIGLIGIIVMMQMFSVFEGQKRSTTGGDDAISSGGIALYGLQRDMQQSGWGISALPLIGCTIKLPSQPAGSTIPLMPVTINSPLITGQDSNTDTLLVVSGTANGSVEGDNIDSQPVVTNYAVHTPSAFTVGEQVVAQPSARASPCNLTLEPVTVVLSPNVTVGTGGGGMTKGKLYNLGALPVIRVYAIRKGDLTVCDYWANDCGLPANNDDPAIWQAIASNIVSLRAEYGRDTTALGMDAIVDQWDRLVAGGAGVRTNLPVPTIVSSTTAKDTEQCGLMRVSAIRLALVARSSQPEKAPGGVHVTAAAPLWVGSDLIAQGVDATEAAAVGISLPSPDPAWPTWQDFRYKVFQTVVPLRNITSQGVVEGC